ncbi:MAG: SurA N-terminal domain-containing protein, partial [Sphingomonas bacterium]|nr:SurA N-terminal domain-containing protein [Sphingomonas bacterium]
NNKAEGQTVAIVDGQEITLSELNFELGLANVPPGADKAAARSQVLQSMIDRRLLASQAKQEGVETTPDFISRMRRGEEELLISMLSAQRLKSVALPSVRETDAFIASHPAIFANRELWDLNQIQYQAPADAAVQAEIDKTPSFAALAAVLQKNGITVAQQKNRLDTAVVPAELFQKIAALPDGEPFIVRVGDRAIASVIVAREAKPILGEQARPIAAAAMRKEQSAKDMANRVGSLRKASKIEYQKGFAPPKK